MHENLYRIDDLLLRAGGIAALVVLLAAAGFALAGQAAGIESPRDPALDALLRHRRALFLAALCPGALLWAGFTLRRRERKTLAIWRLLRQNAVVSVPALIQNSEFERADVERAVQLLNNRGLGHYVWDRRSDTLQDGRLETTHLHVDECEACGAGVGLAIPIGAPEIPRCPYCHAPVCVESLDERRRKAIAELRAEARPERRGGTPRGAFSLPLFLVLLVCFWPAALVYAVYKWQAPLRP